MASRQEELLLAAALLASQQEEEPEEYEEEEYEEYEEEEYEEDFMNQVGVGVERVLYGITWTFQTIFLLAFVTLVGGCIFG
jgi:hypothetical protein